MLKVTITDDFMINLLSRADDLEDTHEDIILGSGSERTALICDNQTIVKVPNWFQLTNHFSTNSLKKEWIENAKKWNPDSTLLEKDKKSFFIYKTEQSENEIFILKELEKIISIDAIQRFNAEIYRWGEWRGHVIIFCERLRPISEEYIYDYDVVEQVEQLLETMEIELAKCPLNVEDLHGENFGYDRNGKMKFLDFGTWQKKDIERFCIKWLNFYEWKSLVDCDCDNCKYDFCRR